jgi:hypothetical protein
MQDEADDREDLSGQQAALSGLWSVGVGSRELPGHAIVAMIKRGQKTLKYIQRTPNCVGRWIVLRVNQAGAPESEAGYSTMAIQLGEPCEDAIAFQESMGWNPETMSRTAKRPYMAYPIVKVITYPAVRVLNMFVFVQIRSRFMPLGFSLEHWWTLSTSLWFNQRVIAHD